MLQFVDIDVFVLIYSIDTSTGSSPSTGPPEGALWRGKTTEGLSASAEDLLLLLVLLLLLQPGVAVVLQGQERGH